MFVGDIAAHYICLWMVKDFGFMLCLLFVVQVEDWKEHGGLAEIDGKIQGTCDSNKSNYMNLLVSD